MGRYIDSLERLENFEKGYPTNLKNLNNRFIRFIRYPTYPFLKIEAHSEPLADDRIQCISCRALRDDMTCSNWRDLGYPASRHFSHPDIESWHRCQGFGRLATLKNLERPIYPSVESVENRVNGILDTLDTSLPRAFQKISPARHPANDAELACDAVHRLWSITRPDGTALSVSHCPPATLAEVQADYPGCTVTPETDPPPAPGLEGEPLKIAQALLRHWGEDDPATVADYLDGLRDPERLEQMFNAAVAAGIATDVNDPAPTPHQTAACARCRHWQVNPINPKGGFGRCLTAAPASLKPGSCWPWLTDAEIRCTHFEKPTDE